MPILSYVHLFSRLVPLHSDHSGGNSSASFYAPGTIANSLFTLLLLRLDT